MNKHEFDKPNCFPVYPEKLRKYARFMLRIRYYLLASLFLGPVLLALGIESQPQHPSLIFAGLFLLFPGCLFFSSIHAGNALIQVDIQDDGIHILDEKGKSFRSTEYRYIRHMEIQTFQVTEISSEQTKQNYPPLSGLEETFILLYLNNAMCFEDLGLRQLRKRGQPLYWCDRLFHHHNCIAFVCNEEAWRLLQAKMASHADSKSN